MSENVFAVLQQKLLTEFRDPMMFSTPFRVGDVIIISIMIDLGAYINVKPYSLYDRETLSFK